MWITFDFLHLLMHPLSLIFVSRFVSILIYLFSARTTKNFPEETDI